MSYNLYNIYDVQQLQRIWEMVRAQEWERVYRRRLEEYRRMVLYHLQWGTPTGPYWAPTPTRPWWIDGAVWSHLQQLLIGSPPYPL